jgi:hypothetical protein
MVMGGYTEGTGRDPGGTQRVQEGTREVHIRYKKGHRGTQRVQRGHGRYTEGT